MKIANIIKAKHSKFDEFYTQYADIAKEMMHYRGQFAGKAVYCNCDDPARSQFYKFFKDEFHSYGLKHLTATYLNPHGDSERADYDGTAETRAPLQSRGDFRSPECVRILAEEADIVATNPPFSLLNDYFRHLADYGKQFIVLMPLDSVVYKQIWPAFAAGGTWFGVNRSSMDFEVPDSYAGTVAYSIGEKRYASMGKIRWTTNLPHDMLQKRLPLAESYDPQKYPAYANYDQAVEVGRVDAIPADYDGVMGVPITFLDRYNPEQFEIAGLGRTTFGLRFTKKFINPKQHHKDGRITNGGKINILFTLETDEKPEGITYYTADNAGYLTAPYCRVLIRRR